MQLTVTIDAGDLEDFLGGKWVPVFRPENPGQTTPVAVSADATDLMAGMDDDRKIVVRRLDAARDLATRRREAESLSRSASTLG